MEPCRFSCCGKDLPEFRCIDLAIHRSAPVMRTRLPAAKLLDGCGSAAAGSVWLVATAAASAQRFSAAATTVSRLAALRVPPGCADSEPALETAALLVALACGVRLCSTPDAVPLRSHQFCWSSGRSCSPSCSCTVMTSELSSDAEA